MNAPANEWSADERPGNERSRDLSLPRMKGVGVIGWAEMIAKLICDTV